MPPRHWRLRLRVRVQGGTFNMAFTAVSTVIEETAQIVEESRSRRERPGTPRPASHTD